MKTLLIMIALALLLGCKATLFHHYPETAARDTLIIRDTVSPSVIIIRDTLKPDTIRETVVIAPEVIVIRDTLKPDTVRETVTSYEMPLNPWPGIILPFNQIRSDTVYRVWLQWGFMGPWHQYLLNDTVR